MTYNPDRFLGTPSRPAERDPRDFAFGFGRRICPGKELADASIFMTLAMVLSVFNIEKAKDSTGKILEPVAEYTSGVIS